MPAYHMKSGQNTRPIENEGDFEALISELPTGFVNVPMEHIHAEIIQGQRKVCEFLGLDGSLLLEFLPGSKPSVLKHYWMKKENVDFLSGFELREFHYSIQKLRQGEIVAFSDPEELPQNAVQERRYCQQTGLISCAIVPLRVGNEGIGIISWESRSARIEWSHKMLNRIELVSGVFAGAIAFLNAKRQLQEQLRFERLLMDLSATLVRAPGTEIQEKLTWGLRCIGEFLDMDRIGALEFNPEKSRFKTVYRWRAVGEPSIIDPPNAKSYPWMFAKLSRGEMIKFTKVTDLPDMAYKEKQFAIRANIKSSIVVPLKVGEDLLGALAFSSTRNEQPWPERIVTRLCLAGEIIANVLHRNRVQQGLDSRLRFEKLLFNLSARFVDVAADQLDYEIQNGLRELGECLECQDSSIITISDECGLSLVHRWVDKKIERDSLEGADVALPWATGIACQGKVVAIEHLDDLPEVAAFEKKYLQKKGVKSVLAVPLIVNEKPFCIFTIISYYAERLWSDYVIHRVTLFGGIIANAIRRRTAELNLREAELRYRTVADFTYDWEYWTSPQGDFLYVSPACKRISGYEAREFVDNPALFHRIILPEDRHIWVDPEKDTCRAEEPRELRFRIRRRDGQIRWVENICRPLIGDGNKCLGYRGSNRDITTRMKGEIELNSAFNEIKRLKEQLEVENIYLKEEIKLEHQHNTIIGKSAAIKTVLKKIEQVAGTDATVLITGETGTGKELIARAIHDLSSCSGRVMVTVNCSALPATLVENELFGREKGAYTGALSRQVGRFEVADGSTLFLDEIGELPLELQAKLLRVIQEGQFERLGSPKSVNVNVRIIAATNRDLAAAVKARRFREDLFYRLNVFPIEVPPLRERKEDIEKLVWFFVREHGEKMGKNIKTISRRDLDKMRRYPWPGNVRELRNIVERAMIISKDNELQVEIPKYEDGLKSDTKTLFEVEKKHILKVLERTSWRVSGKQGAARILDINPKTLESRMKKLGISRKKTPDI